MNRAAIASYYYAYVAYTYGDRDPEVKRMAEIYADWLRTHNGVPA